MTFGSTQAISFRHNIGARKQIVIEASPDDGVNWHLISRGATTNGSITSTFRWVVDLPPTTRGRIRVRALDGSRAYDVSSAFSVGTRIPATPRAVDLGTLGGANSEAVAANASGHVVGSSDTAARAVHAFLWTPDAGMVDLGTLPGCQRSGAVAINDSGHVVGNCESDDGRVRGFLWTPAQGMVDLGTLGGRDSRVAAISATGQVVGTSQTSVGADRAFSWTSTTGMIDIGGGDGSYATAVNAIGDVVGEAGHAFVWTAAGGMRDLGDCGADCMSNQARGRECARPGRWDRVPFSRFHARVLVDRGRRNGQSGSHRRRG